MDVLDQFLSEDDEKLFSCTSADLEDAVQVLTNKVLAEMALLEKTKAELVTLEAETKQRSAERESYVSLAAQTVELEGALTEEAKTKEQLRTVSQALEQFSKDAGTDSSNSSGENMFSKLKADTDRAIASLSQRSKQLLEEKEELIKLMEIAQSALARAHQEEQEAEKEQPDVQGSSAQGSARGPQKSEADNVLDTCIKELGLLHILPNKHNRK
ncbi:uncharacterized protein RCH25_004425 [Pelodytes ibericus]